MMETTKQSPKASEQLHFNLECNTVTMLADTITPVSIYLKLRDRFPNAILLESSDYHGAENSMSFVCFDSIASFSVNDDILTTSFPDSNIYRTNVSELDSVPISLENFVKQFNVEQLKGQGKANGLFGYSAFDAVRYFENLELKTNRPKAHAIPDMHYAMYRYVIAIDHFSNTLQLSENRLKGDESSKIDELKALIQNQAFSSFPFQLNGEESSNITDEDFIEMVRKGKYHCYRGDVFQIVLSRQYKQGFQGDEFNVYRALRSINPSPYLFYFDYGSYKLFGSSPEAQLVVENGKAVIHPIAGTFKRTGDDASDRAAAVELAKDPKENAEHVMLVDLARNDLGRSCRGVKVETYREVQFYSHVIHLVSKVTGKMQAGKHSLQVMADSFPAGTLSGAPKYKAMELIDEIENQNRGYYGGCLGFLGFDGSFNQAIMIRSFLSKDNYLFCQAGAGIVSKSDEQKELEEVNNKLAALKKALILAEKI